MGTAGATKAHEKKDADGKSLHVLEMVSKRKYGGQADESNANFECPIGTSAPIPLTSAASRASTSDAEARVRFWYLTMLCTSCMH